MAASKELFEAMAMGATRDVLDAIDLKHKQTYDARRKVRGTALPKDIVFTSLTVILSTFR